MSLVEMLGHLWSMRGEISLSTIWEKWNACIGLRLYILFNFLYFQGIYHFPSPMLIGILSCSPADMQLFILKIYLKKCVNP